MSFFRKLLQSELKRFSTEGFAWIFPVTVGATWLLWPALDQEWLMDMGLASDPELPLKRVEDAKEARLDAFKVAKGIPLTDSGAKAAPSEPEEEEEEEEEVEVPKADDDDDDGGEPGEDETEEDGGDEVDSGGDDDEEEDDDEEKVVIKPLYLPTKGEKLDNQDIWDNFTLKAVKMTEDDDDDDDEDDDDDDEE